MKSKIYLINTGELKQGDISCVYNPDDKISLPEELNVLMEKERKTFNPSITPGQMYNIRTIEKRGGKLLLTAGYTDYVEHVSHARVGVRNRDMINPQFNAFCAESVDRTSDGLIISLRRDKNLPHGPGIYTGAGGYGVHFRGRKNANGDFIPLNRADPFDVESFYIGRELEVPEDSFTLSWLGLAKCYDLSFDLPANFLAQLSHSSDDILRIRKKDKKIEEVVLDDMINFTQDNPESILGFLSLIGMEKSKLPKDALGMPYGENPLTGKLGINDDQVAVLLQYMQRKYSDSYQQAKDLLDEKGYEVIDVTLFENEKLNLAKMLIP